MQFPAVAVLDWFIHPSLHSDYNDGENKKYINIYAYAIYLNWPNYIADHLHILMFKTAARKHANVYIDRNQETINILN